MGRAVSSDLRSDLISGLSECSLPAFPAPVRVSSLSACPLSRCSSLRQRRLALLSPARATPCRPCKRSAANFALSALISQALGPGDTESDAHNSRLPARPDAGRVLHPLPQLDGDALGLSALLSNLPRFQLRTPADVCDLSVAEHRREADRPDVQSILWTSVVLVLQLIALPQLFGDAFAANGARMTIVCANLVCLLCTLRPGCAR